MKMNRRNVLVGLGTIVVGGGAALGTGAFSTVEADRTVDISTGGDEDALIGFAVSGDLAGEDGDVIAFELDANVNLDGTTTFEEAFTVTNNREDDAGSVSIEIEDESGTSLINGDDDLETGMNFVVVDGDETDVADGGESVTFNVVFDLTGVTTTDEGDGYIPGSITIVATDASD